MLSARMLKTIEYLQEHPLTSYNEIALKLDISTRNVRYDIDKINELLSKDDEMLIEKCPKGVLIVSQNIDVQDCLNENTYVFSKEERQSINQLYYYCYFLIIRN